VISGRNKCFFSEVNYLFRYDIDHNLILSAEKHLVERSQAFEKEEEEEEEEDSDVIHWNVDFSRRVNSHNFGDQSFERPN